MAWFRRSPDDRPPATGNVLVIDKLDVHYGRSHALQEVSLTLERGVLAVVGRNGMGKTTLCNAITGLIPASGSVRLEGEELLGLPPNAITNLGIGYVPQGRRVWPSLSVDEHLRLAAGGRKGAWTPKRVYHMFPRLSERRENGGAELSGGEQQMLAIARALLFNPRLLVMDEPTEGLAPVIVEQVVGMLKTLVGEGAIAVLLIEQNLGVAIDVADDIAVMVNGRIARRLPATELAADSDLQQRLLGVRAGAADAELPPEAPPPVADDTAGGQRIFTIRRAGDDAGVPSPVADEPRTVRGFTRWNSSDGQTRPPDRLVETHDEPAPDTPSTAAAAARGRSETERAPRVLEFPVATSAVRAAYIAGTFDTKGRELQFMRNCIDRLGVRTVTVDLSTSGKPSSAMVHPCEVARHHPRGERAVFTGDRGSAVT